MKNVYLFIIPMLFILNSCENFSFFNTTTDPIVINESDPEPVDGVITIDSNTYKVWLPSNLEESSVRFPLVIGLHGSTSLTDVYYNPCLYKTEDMENYPCIYIAPNNTNQGFGTGAEWFRQELNTVIHNSKYKVDTNRIYIIGFSMGASGTTSMAQDLYDDYGYLTAGIVPADGGDLSSITSDEVRNHLSSWFHYGHYSQESDYNIAKSYYVNATETTENGSITYTDWSGTNSFESITKTLTEGGVEVFKITQYVGMGHTDGPVYKVSATLDWLFSLDITNR